MEKLIRQNPLLSPSSIPSGTSVTNLVSTPLISPMNSPQNPPSRNISSSHPGETNEVIVYPSSVSLRVCINMKVFIFPFIYIL
jgi:hypothetical protein